MKHLCMLLFCLSGMMPVQGQDRMDPADTYTQVDLKSKNPDIVWRIGFNLDFVFADFDDFADVVGSYNTDVIHDFVLTGPEAGVLISDLYAGVFVELGYLYDYCTYKDSLVVNQLSSAYGVNLGYDIISSDKIRLTPLLSFRILRLRLKNYDNDSKIPLTQYMDDRDLDLRFSQSAVTAGLNLDYKIYIKKDGEVTENFWSLGLYGGYIGKLDKSIWLWSQGNRLTTDRMMNVNHFTFMCSVSFFIRDL